MYIYIYIIWFSSSNSLSYIPKILFTVRRCSPSDFRPTKIRSWVGAPGLDPWRVLWRSGGWFPTWPRIACGGYWSWNFLCLGAKTVRLKDQSWMDFMNGFQSWWKSPWKSSWIFHSWIFFTVNGRFMRISMGILWFHGEFLGDISSRVAPSGESWPNFFLGKLVVLPRFLGVVLGNSCSGFMWVTRNSADIHMAIGRVFWVKSWSMDTGILSTGIGDRL